MTQAVVTFGVDSTLLQTYLPQINMTGANDIWTSARCTKLIRQKAATVCGMLVAAGIDPDTVAASTTSVEYENCQALIAMQVVVAMAYGTGGFGVGMEDALQDLRDEIRDLKARYTNRPKELGQEDASTSTPKVKTNVPTQEQVDDGTYTVPPSRKWATTTRSPMKW